MSAKWEAMSPTFEIYSDWVPGKVAGVRGRVGGLEMVHKLWPHLTEMGTKKMVTCLGCDIYSTYHKPPL